MFSVFGPHLYAFLGLREPLGLHLGTFGVLWGSFGVQLGTTGCYFGDLGVHFGVMGTHEDPMDIIALPLERMTIFRPKSLTLLGVFEGTMTFVCIFTTFSRLRASIGQTSAAEAAPPIRLFEDKPEVPDTSKSLR